MSGPDGPLRIHCPHRNRNRNRNRNRKIAHSVDCGADFVTGVIEIAIEIDIERSRAASIATPISMPG
jgi:hypothetical protein